MPLSLTTSNEIMADVIYRHQLQIKHLQVAMDDTSNPNNRIRTLMKLEAELQDIRQGLYAAAYVAMAFETDNNRTTSPNANASEAAVAKRVRQRFRDG